MARRICGIYCITHIASGRQYVGQSVHIRRRWGQHKAYGKSLIGKAIQKHGEQSFRFEILEKCSKDELDRREKFWIAHLDTAHPNGYNLDLGGGHAELTEEALRNKRAAARRRSENPQWRREAAQRCKELAKQDNWIKANREVGRENSKDPTWRIKISEGHKRRLQNPKTREKFLRRMSEAKDTPEAIANFRASREKLFSNPDFVEKFRAAAAAAKDDNWRINQRNSARLRATTDKKLYAIIHKDSGRVLVGMRYYLTEWTGCKSGNLKKAIDGKIRHCKGWTPYPIDEAVLCPP